MDSAIPYTFLGHIRQPSETPATRLVSAIEKIITPLICLPTAISVFRLAVTKLHENYKGRVGWTTADIVAGYV